MASKKDKQGYLLMAGVALVLIAFFAFKLFQDRKPKAGADNCIGVPTANTVIVLDHSEQISDQTREEIAARALAFIHSNVTTGERVSVFTVSDLSKRSLKPMVSLCKPPEDGNRLVESTRLLQKKFHDNFEKPIRQALMVAPADAKESPIAQALTDISLSQYLRGERNQLLIFSDMLENTSTFSIYKCTSGPEGISRYRESRRGAQERPEFRNTSVALHMIPRAAPSREMLKCRDQLWGWFFGNNSGDHAGFSVDYLPGGVPIGPNEKVVKQ